MPLSPPHNFTLQGEKFMNWINVKEKLPAMGASAPVLASMGGNCVMFGYFEETDKGIIFVNVSENDDVFADCRYGLDEISHWMPLPAPAKLDQ